MDFSQISTAFSGIGSVATSTFTGIGDAARGVGPAVNQAFTTMGSTARVARNEIRTIPGIFNAVRTSGYSAAASFGPLGKTVAATGWQFASLKQSFARLLPALRFLAPVALLAGAAVELFMGIVNKKIWRSVSRPVTQR